MALKHKMLDAGEKSPLPIRDEFFEPVQGAPLARRPVLGCLSVVVYAVTAATFGYQIWFQSQQSFNTTTIVAEWQADTDDTKCVPLRKDDEYKSSWSWDQW